MIGLDNLDKKILRLLSEEQVHPSGISRKLEVLRTTIQYRLNRLCKAGLIQKNISGRKSVWRAVYKKSHNKNRFRVYEDRDIIQAYKQLLTLPRHTIIFSVQGSSAAKSEFYNLPSSFIKDAHKVFKRKEIIMKGILNEKSLKIFDKLNDTMLKSHINRPQGLKMFYNEKFISAGEIMSTEKLLLISNPKLKFALVIKDKDITSIVNDTLKVLFEILDGHKTFDLNHYLKSK